MIEIDLSLTLFAAFVIGINLVVHNLTLATGRTAGVGLHIYYTLVLGASLGIMAAAVYVEGVKAGVARTCVVEEASEQHD